MSTKNRAWNLNQGDERLFAKSSFTVSQGSYVDIRGYYLRNDDVINVLLIDDAPDCDDVDNIATVYATITYENKAIKIGSAGRYILSRQSGETKEDILSLNSSARVELHKIKQGIFPQADQLG